MLMGDKKVTPKKGGKFYEWNPIFLEQLAKIPNVSRAARKAGTTRKTAYSHRKTNEAFAASWDDALEVACDRLEEEMWRRAVKGVDHPVIYEGEITDTYKKYSDTLIIFLAKAHRPDKFRERMDVTSGGERIKAPIIYLPNNKRDGNDDDRASA